MDPKLALLTARRPRFGLPSSRGISSPALHRRSDIQGAKRRLDGDRRPDRICDEAFLVRVVVQRPRLLNVELAREHDLWTQRNRREVPDPSAVSTTTPLARSKYSVTMTPAVAQRCRYQSLWHAETAAMNNSSGFHREGSPRNAGSDDPTITAFAGPAAVIS
jgi:hypothetical protein